MNSSDTKSVGGKQVPRSKFAYVGDPNDKSTWKLPIDTPGRIRNALARVSETKDIPSTAKHHVLDKIRTAAHEAHILTSATATQDQAKKGFKS